MVICGFAGIGKTYLGNKYKNVIDLDTLLDELPRLKEQRKGLTERGLNYEWPDNYLEAIVDANSKYDFVLVSQSIEILEELHFMKIPYTLAFPKLELKEEYIQRCIDRGNQENFIWFIDRYYESLITKMMKKPDDKIILNKGEYLEDALIKREYILELKEKGA